MNYDITVIGGGPGGYVAAIKAAQQGKKVCIIENKRFGGVCLNEGCIPTKTLIQTVNIYDQVKNAEKYAIEGIDSVNIKVSMNKLQKRKKRVIRQLVNGVKSLLRGNGVTAVEGNASFIDKNTIKVNDKTITSEYFIVATGSTTFMPPFISLEGNTNVITSKEALDISDVPKSIVIIGGDVIGIEFAYIFSKLGSKVYVLELMDKILPLVDDDVSSLVKKKFEKAGVVLYTGVKVKKIFDNKVSYEIECKQEIVEADVVLMAVGRIPNTEGLNAETIGIKFDEKAIETDEYMATNIKNIYAIGDVNGKSMFAHTASREGIIAVENICGKIKTMNYDYIPSCVYIEPEIASIGLTEEQAKEKYENVKVGVFPLAANGKALVEGETEGIIKVILEGELNQILGVHIFGVHATDIISEISVAMNLEATAEEIINSVHPHPTVSEIIPEAFMVAIHKDIHAL